MKYGKKLLGVLAILLACVLGLIGYLRITEYRPNKKESVAIKGKGKQLSKEEEISILTYNIGYGALSHDQDFFMDGGKNVRPESKDIIERNVKNIASQLKEQDTDIVLLQEADVNSKRSYGVNEVQELWKSLGGTLGFATNFKCNYIPYPFPTIGKVNGGIATMSKYQMTDGMRIAFPSSFKWPVSMCQLKRCLLVERTKVAGSDKELVVVNLHLEAYDSGEGKKAQSKILAQVLQEEYKKGNYVIAGGDFNQYFSCIDKSKYPLKDTEHFTPGEFPENYFADGWQMVMDDTTPSSRLLNEPYDADSENTQYYMLDGFLVSPNVEITDLKTLDYDFLASDHNPVRLSVKLK